MTDKYSGYRNAGLELRISGLQWRGGPDLYPCPACGIGQLIAPSTTPGS